MISKKRATQYCKNGNIAKIPDVEENELPHVEK